MFGFGKKESNSQKIGRLCRESNEAYRVLCHGSNEIDLLNKHINHIRKCYYDLKDSKDYNGFRYTHGLNEGQAKKIYKKMIGEGFEAEYNSNYIEISW